MTDLDTTLRQHVKRTPELPADGEWILLWIEDCWRESKHLCGDSWYVHGEHVDIEDGQYWLPLPTFDPSETSA